MKLSKDFVGKDALVKINAAGVRRKLVGLEVDGPCTIRHGYPLLKNGKEVGHVTSGPLLAALTRRNLGLGYVATEHAGIGTELEIEFHGSSETWASCLPPWISISSSVPMPACSVAT